MSAHQEPSKLDEWNALVSKHDAHWEYYSKMLSYSLQKSANSPITKYFYPFFYQERLLKQKFVKNMQVLGDISHEEFNQYETFSRTYFNENLYHYYKHPGRGNLTIYITPLIASVLMFAHSMHVPYHPKKFKWLMPITLLLGITCVLDRVKMMKFGELVSLTQWVIEKRKAEVWLEKETIQLPPLIQFPLLIDDVVKIIVEEKLFHS